MFGEEILYGQPSWVMESSTVRMAVTQLGGHMGPVQFCREQQRGSIEPYAISPWQCEENTVPEGQSEKVLRGDFFCLPFGYAGANYPSHGRTAGARWTLDGCKASHGVHELCISMKDALGPARVVRQYFLRDGEEVVYDRTTVMGLSGMQTMGHHAVLRVPAEQARLLVSTSPQRFGMTHPKPVEDADGSTLQSLAVGARFEDLRQVPLVGHGDATADLSAHPSEWEATDLLQVAVSAEEGQPAWTAAVNTQEGYLWFALRDAAVLPSTLLWVENRGRQEPPWNGRSCLLGLEDVCSFFDLGSEVSGGENAFSARGIKTVHAFDAERPSVVSYVQGATQVPRGFGRVKSVRCGAGCATFTDAAGEKVRVAVEPEFVFGKDL